MVLEELMLLMGAAGVLAASGATRLRQHHRALRRMAATLQLSGQGPRVLILSASIGGGHNAAAAVLRAELEQAGYSVAVLDGFASATPLLSRYFAWSYPVQLRYTPWLYDWEFWSSHRRLFAKMWRRIYATMSGEAFRTLVELLQPQLVISTYPLVTQALGVLRRKGILQIPAVAVITDYGVHRLWTAPGIDLHLVPSRVSAAQIDEATGSVRIMRPLVRAAFLEPRDRAVFRERYGFAPKEFVALIVAGAWGIGRVELIVRDVAACGVRTVVVCGRNRELATRLQREYAGHPAVWILGWTDELPELMAAADCLVQNAGGLTCLEAIASRLPIIMYRPITGHGVFNALTMERAGVARWIRSSAELRDVLSRAANGSVPLPVPRIDEEAVPAIAAILELLDGHTQHSRPTVGQSEMVLSGEKHVMLGSDGHRW